MKTAVLLILSLFIAQRSFAASVYKQALDKKLDSYIQNGVVLGGQSGLAFSLLNVRRSNSKAIDTERIVLDMGDHELKPLINRLSFFHVSIQQKPTRVVVDLAQVQKSKISAEKLQQIFARSPIVKKTSLSFDPVDFSASLSLDLAVPSEIEVFQMPSTDRPSRIVIDIRRLKAKSNNLKPGKRS